MNEIFRMPKVLNKVLLGLLAVLALCLLIFVVIIIPFGGSLNRAKANEWGCLYGGGLFENKGLKQEVAPGSSGGFTVWDRFVTVPSDDRYLFIDNDPQTADIGANKIIVPAKGTTSESQGIVNVDVEIQVRFVINENACDLYTDKLDRLKPLNFDGTDGKSAGGWGKFLIVQVNQALIKAARPLVAPYNYVELYANTPTLVDGNKILIYDYIEDGFATQLTEELNKNLGDTYFCGPSYRFDGEFDGVFDNGCPPLEVTVKRIAPVDGQLITNLENTVKNQEQIKVIESEKQKKLAQTEADKQTKIAQTKADEETQLAEVTKQRAVETAKAEKDQAVAEAQKAVFEAQQINAQIQAFSDTAFCSRLTDLGVDCAEYYKAINWRPSVILGSSGANVNITPK